MKVCAALLALVFFSGCTIQQARIGFGIGVAADYSSTDWALAHDFREGNPAVYRAGLTTAALTSLLTVLVAEWYLHRDNTDAARVVYAIGAAIHLGAAGSNIYQIRKVNK